MTWERKAARLALASALGLASTACSAGDATVPIGATGPYATIVRVDVLSGPTVTTVGDTVQYTGAASDNANNELPVALTWHTTPATILRLHPATGAGRALAAGRASVWASVGVAPRRASRPVTVNPPAQ